MIGELTGAPIFDPWNSERDRDHQKNKGRKAEHQQPAHERLPAELAHFFGAQIFIVQCGIGRMLAQGLAFFS